MFAKLKNALSSPESEPPSRPSTSKEAPKYPYTRPHFLYLKDEEVQASTDHRLRPIISPNRKLAYCTGYAECINSGKSRYNEDQAVTHQGVLASGSVRIPYNYYALFDGHAGVGAAVCAANQLHHVLHQRLVDAQDSIWRCYLERNRSRHSFITGALEITFSTMDDIIKEELMRKQTNGGCTALVVVVILGYAYIANAGDSRAAICGNGVYKAVSNDFTPETERRRILRLAQMKPHLLGKHFTYLHYAEQPTILDLGKRVLYKDAFMRGWCFKTIGHDDLKQPIISGQGKRSRVMGTIGVTRGLGDHDLVSVNHKVPIKPFLSCHPQVQVFDITNAENCDVLVMATDGLWDVLDGNAVVNVISDVAGKFDSTLKSQVYASAATCLAGAARGTLSDHQWVMKDGKSSSMDDISVFVIPLFALASEHVKMISGLNINGLRAAKGISLKESEKPYSNNRKQRIRSVLKEILLRKTKEEEKPADICIIKAKVDNLNKHINFDIIGQTPSPEEQFVLVNVDSIESVKFLNMESVQISSEDPNATNIRRSRSHPNINLAANTYNEQVKWAGSELIYTIELIRKEKPTIIDLTGDTSDEDV